MSVVHIVKALVDLAEAHGKGSVPWSLGEVLRGDEMYGRLVRWAAASSSSMPLNKSLCSSISIDLAFGGPMITQREGYGLALLALACEQARRQATAKQVWRAFAKLTFESSARARVLTPAGQPTVGFTEAIEAAVKRFRLRNIVDRQDKHRWKTTVFLQIGLPLGSLDQLPNFLASQAAAPDAVRMLLSSEGGSTTFQKDWATLQSAARRHTRDQLARAMQESVWFGWSQRAAHRACEAALRPRPAVTSSRTPTQEIVTHEQEEQDEQGTIVGEPQYLPDSQRGKPVFACPLLPLGASEEQPPILDLWVNGTRQVRLTRTSDGYLPLDRQRLRPLPPGLDSVVVLRDRHEHQVDEAQQVSLLGSETDSVAVYETGTGDRAQGPLRRDTSYVLVLAPGHSLVRGSLDAVALGEGTLVYLDAGWPDIEVRDETQVVWRIHAAKVLPSRPRQPRRHPPGLELLGPEGWRRVAAHETLDKRALETTSLRVHLPGDWTTASLVGGDAFLCHAPQRATRVRRLPCYGEPLLAVKGRSFADPAALTLPLVGSVVDRGAVHGLQGDQLSFEPPYRWSEGFRVLVWPRTGPLFEASVTGVDEDAKRVGLALAETPRALALVFGTTRVGAWWSEDWSAELGTDAETTRRALISARWMRLPFLAAPHRARVQAVAKTNLSAAYRAWVRPDPVASVDEMELEQDYTTAWTSAARSLLYDCAITPEQRGRVDAALDNADTVEFGRSYVGLIGIGATARLRRFLVLEVGPEPVHGFHAHATSSAGFAKQSQWYFLGRTDSPNSKLRDKLLGELRTEIRRTMAVEHASLEKWVESTRHWSGAARALNVTPFRVYASIRRLDELVSGKKKSA